MYAFLALVFIVHITQTSLLTQNVKAILSYGGWGGSQFFSWAMSPANRTATVNSILKLVAEYKLDGIDFE